MTFIMVGAWGQVTPGVELSQLQAVREGKADVLHLFLGKIKEVTQHEQVLREFKSRVELKFDRGVYMKVPLMFTMIGPGGVAPGRSCCNYRASGHPESKPRKIQLES